MTCFKTTELACGADWDPAAAGGSGAGGPDGSGRGSGNGSGGSSAGPWSARPQAWQRSASFLLKDPQFGHGWSFGMGLLRADDRGHVEPPVLEDERRESGLVVRAAHLGHADSPLHLDVRDRMHFEFQDPVREEGLVPPRLGRLEPEERSLGSRLPEDERRRPEIPEPLEELEQLRPSIRELREDLEGLQRINHDQVDPIDVLLRRQGAPEELHPRFRRALPDLLLDRADVEDVDVAADRLHVEAHGGHLILEALPRLLEGDVEASGASLRRVPM